MNAEQHLSNLPGLVAFWTLFLFLWAILVALTLTLLTAPPAAKFLAAVVVAPIVVVTLLLLYFERKGKRWSFAGAAALGIFGVSLRLIINSQPSLEVGGGLPIAVTLVYVVLGLAVIGSSLWSYLTNARRGTAPA